MRRRGGGDNRGKARSDPFELTEVKLNAQTERARRERERRGTRTDARTEGPVATVRTRNEEYIHL